MFLHGRPGRFRPNLIRSAVIGLGLALALLTNTMLFVGAPANATLGSNDYPYANSWCNTWSGTTCTVQNVDPWGFYEGECTSFVAWRLNNDNGVGFSNSMGGPNGTGSGSNKFGDASNWASHASSIGYTVNTTPAAGSVAVWPSSVGHVGYVDAVNSDGTINTEEYNWSGDHAYHTRTSFNWSAASVQFIHIKDSTPPPTSPGVIVIRTGGDLYGKNVLTDAWYSYTLNPGPVSDVRVSGTRITWTGTNGDLYAKDWDATHSFGNSWYDEYGPVDQYAASSSVLVIRTGGNLYGKHLLGDSWYSYVLNPGPVADVRVSGNRITWTGTNGHIYAKDWDATNSFGNSWYDEVGPSDQYAASDQLFVVRNGTSISGKTSLGGSWTYAFNNAPVADVRVSGNRITYTSTGGELYAKDSLTGSWYDEYGAVDQYAASSTLLVIRAGGALYGKVNLNDSWTTLMSSGAADVRVSGNRITFTDTSGNVWAKDGLSGTWYEEYSPVDQYAASG